MSDRSSSRPGSRTSPEPADGRSRAGGTDRAVSDVIGFILVFSLVVSVVGIVSVVGFDTLRDARDAEQVDNAERAMEVLANNMADIHRRGAPSRATEISLEEAQMFMGEPVKVRIRNNSPPLDETFTIRPIVYRGVDDTRLVYVMGAIFRVQREGEVVVREWSPVTDDNYVSIPIVNTTSTTGESQSLQSSTVLVRANAKERALVRSNATGAYNALSIRIETPRNELWERMLDDHPGFTSCTTGASPDFVACEVDGVPRTFHLVETRIAVTIKE